jgi:hypothetical protein
MSAETVIAAAVLAACDVELSLPYRPARIMSKMAFVTPANVWKEPADQFSSMSIGLDVFLIISSGDQQTAVTWLDEQTTILMSLAALDLDEDQVTAVEVEAPFVFKGKDSASFLACRVAYSRFTIGD